jgi:hypothetical protein
MRPRLSFANVVSVLALFIALGGSAYAFHLGKNSVGPKQLKKNSVTTPKIKNGAVTTAKIKDGAVNGAKVATGTLTGTQVNASTLGKVPSAAQADSASVAGNGAQRISFSNAGTDPAPANTLSPGAHQLLSLGNLTLSASCTETAPLTVRTYVAMSSAVRANIEWGSIKFENPGDVAYSDGTTIGPGGNPSYAVSNVTGGNRSEIGQWLYRSATETITVSLSVYAAGESSGDEQCEVFGTAVRAPS